MEFIHLTDCSISSTVGRAAAESFERDVERGLPTWEIVLIIGLIVVAALAFIWSQVQGHREAQEDKKTGRRR